MKLKIKKYLILLSILICSLQLSSCGATGAIQGEWCLGDYLEKFFGAKKAVFVGTVINKTSEFLELGFGTQTCLKIRLDAEQLAKLNLRDIVTLTKQGTITWLEANQNAGLDTEPVFFQINSNQVQK